MVRTPATERGSQTTAAAAMALGQKLAIAEACLAGSRHLAGDTLALADIQLGHVLHRYFAIGIIRRPLPHLAAYYAWLTARPASRQHVIVSYDELKV